jgi:hypothetical protein
MRSPTAVALLSNGSYNVMVTSAGAGYSSRDVSNHGGQFGRPR